MITTPSRDMSLRQAAKAIGRGHDYLKAHWLEIPGAYIDRTHKRDRYWAPEAGIAEWQSTLRVAD